MDPYCVLGVQGGVIVYVLPQTGDWKLENQLNCSELVSLCLSVFPAKFNTKCLNVFAKGLQSRPSTARFTAMRPLSMRASGSHWGWSTNRSSQTGSWAPSAASVRGRHLLDHEALTCLLVLLFIDESRLNTSRLHRVLRNLCYHAQTRSWIIGTLLSVLQHLTDGMQAESQTMSTLSARMKKKSTISAEPAAAAAVSAADSEFVAGDDLPSWLNIYLCAALGSQASVFHLQRGSKRTLAGHPTSRGFPSSSCSTNISVHPQASQLVCRHVLDTLISLAKSFPNAFLPNAQSADTESAASSDKAKTPTPKTSSLQLSPGASAAPGSGTSSAPGSTDFWNLLIKLDNAVGGKRGKSLQRLPSGSSSNGAVSEAASAPGSSFEASPLGQLMMMVAHPVVRRSQLLTDRLLRLLSLVSVGLGDTAQSAAPANTSGLTLHSLT